LVDGRFRVATFAFSFLLAKKGTIFFFDDFVDRNYYHVVNALYTDSQILGRASIIVKNSSKKLVCLKIIAKFLMDPR
jgi:hypothetical protein